MARPASGATFKVEDPSTGSVLCEIANAGTEDAFAALDAAVQAQPTWAKHAPRERGEILRRAYELLMQRQDDLALLMTLEMGKPLPEAKGEIAYAADFLRWFSEEAVRIEGGFSTSPNGQARFLIMQQPVGPSMLVTPWNFPMAMGTRKIGPAIAAGCTAILKPAQQTPLSALALAGILREAGVPDGVLSVLPTTDAGSVTEPLLRDGRIRKMSFTGSTGVGRKLLEQSADQVLRTSMELGGNAPFLCSTTPTWTPRSRARCRPRCATSARRAPPRTASTRSPVSPPSSPGGSASAWGRCGSAAALRKACRWAR